MGTSGALKPTKRAKKIISDIEYIKENYISYYMDNTHKEYHEVISMFDVIEEYVVELSAGKRVLEAKLAEKLKKEPFWTIG